MASSRKATIDFGLSSGQALGPEELAAFAFFAGRKSNFDDKLRDNLIHRVSGTAIRAAVLREFEPGDVICEAGSYGSTAFLLVEGTASAGSGDTNAPAAPPGRTSRSLRRLARMFSRHTRTTKPGPGRVGIGEVTACATLHRTAAPPPQTLGPGDVFGIDTCINFHPRELTVRAETACKVVEMLRSVLDTVRSSGKAGAALEDFHREATIRGALASHEMFSGMTAGQLATIVEACEILTQDDLTDGVLYEEGSEASSVFVVASGTLKLSRKQPGGERILAYSGRGSVAGLEALLAQASARQLVLRPVGQSPLPAVPLTGTVTLGRRRSATIPFDSSHGSISRRHCRLEELDGEIRLFDENTDNGTFVNGRRVQEAIVDAGDRITLADNYTFEIVPVEATAATGARAATATALDNCEIVRIPAEVLRAIAPNDSRIAALAAEVARVLSAFGPSTPAEQAYLRRVLDLNLYNSQNTLLIDLERCTRCDECVRACADAHDGVPRFTRDGPRFGKYLLTLACRSCTDPKCMIGCPVGSIRRDQSLQVQIEDWCIGCGLCANNCPFGNINMIDLATGAAPVEPAGAAPPEPPEPVVPVSAVPVRPAPAGTIGPVDLTSGKLRATVCDLCAGHDGPNCVYACPHDAAIRVNPTAFLSPTDLQVL